MIAGSALLEQDPGLGALRVVRGEVISCMDPDDRRQGLLVEEFDEIDDHHAAWRTVCPLTDAHFMVDDCPVQWSRASYALRERMERGEDVTLAVELDELKRAGTR